MINKFFTGVVILIMAISCTQDASGLVRLREIKIPNGDLQEYMDVNPILAGDKILIDKQKNNYPQVVDDFYATGEVIVLADKSFNSTIYGYNYNGELLWEKRGDPDDPFLFTSIGSIHVYELDDKLEVYDDLQSTFYYFSLKSGEYLGEEYFDLEFNAKHQINPNLYVFSKFGIEGGSSNGNDNYELFFVDSMSYLKHELPYASFLNKRPLFVSDLDIIETSTNVTYLRPFMDTIFTIDSQDVNADATILFETNPPPRDLFVNPEMMNPSGFVLENNHPFVRAVAKGEKYYYLIYQYNGANALSIIDNDNNKLIANSSLIKSGDDLVPTPFLIRSSKMLSVSSLFQERIINKVVNKETMNAEDEKIIDLINNDRDTSKMTVNIFNVK
ncbi:MAG: hypothetical protein ACJAZM_003368 [Cyclobacteriaceae bacterium]|jgi:hypothetical protein